MFSSKKHNLFGQCGMDYECKLISLYLFICNRYEGLCGYCLRFGNNCNPKFTDKEALTIYLFCVMDGKRCLKDVYVYTDRHLRPFFPLLPGYKAFVARLNRLCDVFVPLMEAIERHAGCEKPRELVNVTDSLPIVMAGRGRRFRAKVTPEIAGANGYCATKSMHYYGVKLHVVGARRNGALPLPHKIGITDAGMHDLKAYQQIEPEMFHDVYADKAYQTQGEPVRQTLNYTLYTPPKKEKGQTIRDSADDLLATAVSKVRQPIESFFNWINEKTGIQVASKVRSSNGFIVHVFGRLAAAYLILFKPI